MRDKTEYIMRANKEQNKEENMKYKTRMTQLIIDKIDAKTLIDFGIKKEWLENLEKFRDEIGYYIDEHYEEFEELNKKTIGDFFVNGEVYTKVEDFVPKEDKFYIIETGGLPGVEILTANEIKKYVEEESGIFLVSEHSSGVTIHFLDF